MKIKNVCALDSMYTLLQYLLLNSPEEVERTFLFCRNGISTDVLRHFSGRYYTFGSNSSNLVKSLFLHFKMLLKFPFLFSDKINYWGCDNLGFEKHIIRHHKFQLLEDGLLSYNEIPYKWKNKRFVGFKKFLMGPLACERTFVGEEPTCICRHMSGLIDTLIVHDSKTIVNSFSKLWTNSTKDKRDYINKIYGITDSNLSSLKGYNKILFTQPLSEDGYISENEKINIYRKIIAYAGSTDGFVIKPHPRETTDYSKVFSGVEILETKAPFELYSLNNVRFEEAYTLFSTCVFDFNYEVKAFFFGSQMHDKLGMVFKNNHYGKVKPASDKVRLQQIDFSKMSKL